MEAHHIYFIIGAVVLCTAPVVLLAIAHMEGSSSSGKNAQLEFSSKDIWRQLREENTHIASLSQLLRRAGMVKTDQQIKAVTIAGILCAALALAFGVSALFKGLPIPQALLICGASLLGFPLLAYMFLKKHAEDRQAKLEAETLMLIQTTRMLWRVGLSLPKTLAIICEELKELTPNCATELNLAVNKIESGQSQEEALYDLINSTGAEGFKEYLIVIRQQSITGGSIDKSLDELYLLLQSRRKLELQEVVNKLAGKMSLVMMVCFFPALLIFVGGPSFTSLSKALGDVAS